MGFSLLVADGIRWALVALFVLAFAEKALLVLHRSARWHPVLLISEWRRRWATPLMVTGLIADLAVTLALTAVPAAGGFAASVLTAGYWHAARGVHDQVAHSGCRCFFGILNTSSVASLRLRNASIIALGIVVAITRPISTWHGGGIALMLLTFLFAITRWSGARTPSDTLGKHQVPSSEGG